MSASSFSWRSGRVGTRSRPVAFALVGAVVLVLLAAAMFLYDHARRDVIADGVKIAGVGVGGLDEAAALVRVRDALGASLARPVSVESNGHRWTLGSAEAQLRVDARAMVAQAVAASREGSIFTRTVRGLFGGRLERNIAPVVTYSHPAIGALTARIRAAVDVAARNAYVQPSATGLHEVPGRTGLAVESDRLGARIEHALIASGPRRTVHVPVRRVRPTVGVSQLASKYPAYIIIDRQDFRLRFYQHLKPADTYEIAVGMEGLETPAGLHHIEWKQVDPPWYVPKKAWAGALAGTVVPPGPQDPLKARFMSFEGGAGIHGIDPSEYETIGHNASHGCVRMRIPDVIALYSKTPVGTPVYVA
jgi:lipoprotein-anchoring transpeptidase ErfK/SrfK